MDWRKYGQIGYKMVVRSRCLYGMDALTGGDAGVFLCFVFYSQ